MKKTPFYNFITSKAQEDYQKANNLRPVLTSRLVEARDDRTNWNENNDWTIVKSLTVHDLQNHRVRLFAKDVIHIYEFWSVEKVSQVYTLGTANLNLLDLDLRHRIATDLVKKSDGTYYINLSVFNEARDLHIGDTILMYYDQVCDALCFTVAQNSPYRAGASSSTPAGGR